MSYKDSLMMIKFYEWWRGPEEVAVVGGGLIATYVVIIATRGTSATILIVLGCVLTWLLEVCYVLEVKFIFKMLSPELNYVNQFCLEDGEGNFT